MPLIILLLPVLAFTALLQLQLHIWDEASHLQAVLAGTVLTAAMVALVAVLRHRRHLSWPVIGHHRARDNLRAFALGATLWLVPALAGMVLCLATGWASVTFASPPAAAIGMLPVLALGVLLSEALPEELVIRDWAQGVLAQRFAPWAAVVLQAAAFLLMAWLSGALRDLAQWMFLPGFALILGAVRALSGSLRTSMGVHFAWMTTAQLIHAHVAVEGMATLQFVAFALLPSATLCTVLSVCSPDFRRTQAPQRARPAPQAHR